MLYAADTPGDLAYRDVIDRARDELGIGTAYAVARDPDDLPGAHHGFIDEALVVREIPDYAERMFYVSGPRAMVVASERLLARLGVPASRIKVDFFPGFA
jgi:ferredoxin-NADP reductase